MVTIDPKYEEEVSGCTACVSLVAGKKLYLVCPPATPELPKEPATMRIGDFLTYP